MNSIALRASNSSASVSSSSCSLGTCCSAAPPQALAPPALGNGHRRTCQVCGMESPSSGRCQCRITHSIQVPQSIQNICSSQCRTARVRGLQLAGLAPSQSRPRQGTQTARPQTTFDDNDVELLARLIFAEGANQFRKPGVYLGLGHTVLNRMKARGFPNTLQGVIFDRTPSGVPQFESVGGNLWNLAGNPGALTADNAIAYQAARATANDLLYGSEYNFDDPTGGATYFYSTTRNSPPAGFFTNRINSGRLQETYKAGDPRTGEFRFLRDTQP